MIKKIEINKVLEEIQMMEKLEKPAKFKIIRKVEIIEEEREVPNEENGNENENTNKVGNCDFSISKSNKVRSNTEGFFDKEENVVLSGSVLGLGLGVIAAVAWGTVIYMRNVRK